MSRAWQGATALAVSVGLAMVVGACRRCPDCGPDPMCSYELSFVGGPMQAAGGAIEERVFTPTGCRWAFRGEVPWITVEAGTEGESLQLALKSTNLFTAGGRHELRYGVQFEDIDFTLFRNRTGPSFTFPNGAPSRTGILVNVLPDPAFGRIYQAFGTIGDSSHENAVTYGLPGRGTSV